MLWNRNLAPRWQHRSFILFRFFLVLSGLGLSLPAWTQTAVPRGPVAEARTERALEAARKQGPLALRTFLVDMPKGADLHYHLSGGIYAESFLRAAAEDQLCVDPVQHRFIAPAGKPKGSPPQASCAEGLVPAAQVAADQTLYDALVDAFSMRAFVPSAGVSGHDQFFATFARFSGLGKRHNGEWVHEAATRAAAQNEQFLEPMTTPGFAHTMTLARQIGWTPDFQEFRRKLLAAGLKEDVAEAKKETDEMLAQRNALEHCGQPDAAPACAVTVRFLYQVLRGLPPEVVFAQTLLGFETISADPRFVGINFVMPEDGYVSMRDYRLHMEMLDYLHSVYPQVHISLHAGELAPGMVPPEGLGFHIRSAVEKGHAERVGHGVDVAYEQQPTELFKELAAKHVMVEINLTSNDVILGIKGRDHPLPLYRKYGVPVALSTDDEGVSRIDLTHEYVRAAEEFGLTYADLKKMARTGMEHNFLPGKSLWREEDNFTRIAGECSGQPLGGKAAGACAQFLGANEKAAQQWELERRFHEFEAKW